MAPTSSWRNTLELVAMMVVWNVFSVLANIYIKIYLQLAPFPGVMTLAQYLIGIAMTLVWQLMCYLIFGSRSSASHRSAASSGASSIRPSDPSMELSSGTARRLMLWLCAVNGVGHLLTNMSMGAVSVSFAHTIKAAEPLFSVLLAAVFLRQPMTPLIVCSLLPIVVGIVLATATELTYDHFGFVTAMLSNVVFSARNIISKKLQNASPSLDNVALFLQLSQAGALMLLPYVLLFEDLWAAVVLVHESSSSLSPNVLVILLLQAGVCHCIYNLVSFVLLARVSAVTHAVGNSMKRVVLVVGGWLYFGVEHVTGLNVFGSSLASFGVLLYIFASRPAASTRSLPSLPVTVKHT